MHYNGYKLDEVNLKVNSLLKMCLGRRLEAVLKREGREDALSGTELFTS